MWIEEIKFHNRWKRSCTAFKSFTRCSNENRRKTSIVVLVSRSRLVSQNRVSFAKLATKGTESDLSPGIILRQNGERKWSATAVRQWRTSRIPPVNKAVVTLRWTLRGEDRRDSDVFLAQEISSDKNSTGPTKLRRIVSDVDVNLLFGAADEESEGRSRSRISAIKLRESAARCAYLRGTDDTKIRLHYENRKTVSRI